MATAAVALPPSTHAVYRQNNMMIDGIYMTSGSNHSTMSSVQGTAGATAVSSNSEYIDNNAAHYNPAVSSSSASYNPANYAQQAPPPPSLFSRSELQAIDGFLESFSAPVNGNGMTASINSYPSSSSTIPYHQQPFPSSYSASTAFYRPDCEIGWRGPPPSIASTSVYQPMQQHSHQQPYNKYLSYHPTAYHRPSSPSSASASSSSYPKTLPQADTTTTNQSTIRPARINGSPFSTSASQVDESLEERDKRLRTQANDLAGWLSRYNNVQDPNTAPTQQAVTTTQTVNHRKRGSGSNSVHSPARGQHQASGPESRPPSIGSTSNSESLPTPNSKIQHNTAFIHQNTLPRVINPSEMMLEEPHPKRHRSSITHIPTASASSRGEATTQPIDPSINNHTGSTAAANAPVLTTKTRSNSRSTNASMRRKPSNSGGTGKVTNRKATSRAPAKGKQATSASPASELLLQHDASASPAPPSPMPAVQPESANANNAANVGASKIVLTEEQKRANHIASEQKRRHAIRAAYDALCTVVPSLRAAVQEYEERLSKLHPTVAAAVAAAKGEDGMAEDTPAMQQLQTVAGVLTGGIEVGGEKIDGRAGPRSEAVVLAKTVEYMRDLLDQREESLRRLQDLQQESSHTHAYAGLSITDKKAAWNTKYSYTTAS